MAAPSPLARLPPVVILCGGEGARFREETQNRPKPLAAIGERPLLWHVMRSYAARGLDEFVLCLGYRGDMIKDYFLNYDLVTRDFTLRLGSRSPEFHGDGAAAPWRITFAETGLSTMTGARVKRVESYVRADTFMLTYADGLADLDLGRLLDFHLAHGKVGTVTGVRPPSQFGQLVVDGTRVIRFAEKPVVSHLVSGGFFVFRREFFDYLSDDPGCVLEQGPLERLAADGELEVYRHDGFWQCLDTYKDFVLLNELWRAGRAPWAPEGER